MANPLQELYQSVVKLSDEEKIKLGVNSAKTVTAYLTDKFEEKSATILYALLIGNYVGVDGKITLQEYAFCKAVLGIDMAVEEFNGFIKETLDAKHIELLDQLIDNSPDNVKKAFVALGLAICSIDDNMTAAEQALLSKYID